MTTRLILVGGFLGVGKTTLLLRAARLLTERGLRVGVVTNDQGDDLVDTALVRNEQVTVTEVAGGCFCCRYPDLLKALATLQQTVAPDVILAEPVGSCTDLQSTVVRPLRQHFGDHVQIAPLTILVDPLRNSSRFAAEVDYLFQRQLAEADVLVVTKQDLIQAVDEVASVTSQALRSGTDRVFAVSSTTGAGVDAWLDYVMTAEATGHRRLAIDYDRYAAGEAALGWLNVDGVVTASVAFSPRNWVSYLLRMLDAALDAHGAEIAHIKVMAHTEVVTLKASVTQSRAQIAWDLLPEEQQTTELTFLLNARVQTSPEVLESAVRTSLVELSPFPDFEIRFTRFDCFRPGAPEPTYRM